MQEPDIESPATAKVRLNSPLGLTSWFHPFTYKRFHVLLNSLFKVLCNFPSRYLFAIGLAVIFSLSWSLPAALGCDLKQPDSIIPRLARTLCYRYGPTTRYGKVPLSEGLAEHRDRETPRHTRSTSLPRWGRDFALGFSLFNRRYWGNPFWFLFLRLLICLNQASNLA